MGQAKGIFIVSNVTTNTDLGTSISSAHDRQSNDGVFVRV